MQRLTFDIFSGELEKDAIWVEAVEGLATAKERMKQIASETPGRYFIFSLADRLVLDRTETHETSETPKPTKTFRATGS